MRGILFILGTICAIWVIYDVWFVNRKLNEIGKIAWSIFALIFSIVAAVLYYIVHKRYD